MIRIEISCAHANEPHARDVKAPCDSLRNRSIAVDVMGTFDKAKVEAEQMARDRGWVPWIIPAIGRRKMFICGNCAKRARGEI